MNFPCTFVMKVFNVHFLWDEVHARLWQERLMDLSGWQIYLGGLNVRYIMYMYKITIYSYKYIKIKI